MAQVRHITLALDTAEPAGHLSSNEVGDWSPHCGFGCVPARRALRLGSTYAQPEQALTELLYHLKYEHGVER